MEFKNEWKLILHSSQIADTGDYDGYYELTNDNISIVTKDEIDETEHDVAVMLFQLGEYKWEDWNLDNVQFELYIEKTENSRIMDFIKSKGLLEEYYEVRR